MRLVACIVLILLGAAVESSVDVSVNLEPPEIPFHRQARFSIIVEAPNDVDVRLPQMVDKFGGLAASDIERNTESLRGDRRRVTETYTLDPILIGNYAIEPVEVAWGEEESVVVPSPALRVRDLTDEEKEAAERFEPNAGPISIKNPVLSSWQLWVAVGPVVLLTAVLLVWLLWWRKREVREAPQLLPWEVAYERLRELDQRRLPKAGKYETYYVELSAILRYYIEDRFHLHAPEQTTPEFLAAAAQSGSLSIVHQRLVAGFLGHCDLVKFAQYVPTVEEMDRSFAVVLQFVDETVVEPEPHEQQEAAA